MVPGVSPINLFGSLSQLVYLAAGWFAAVSSFHGQDLVKDKPPGLDMSRAVACKRVDAYEKYEILPNASLTSEDKLTVYFRPLEYKVEPVEKPKPGYRYRASFSQDVRIRKKGEKTVLMKKDKILEFDPSFEDPAEHIYLVNNVGLKGLAPGEYELDIILRDVLKPGSSATQTLAFTIIPVPKATPAKTDEPTEPEGSAGSKKNSKAAKKATKKAGSS